MIGGIVAGPAGAILGGVATDAFITGIDVAKFPDSPIRPDIENPTRYGADAKHRVDNEESIHRFSNEESFNQFVDESYLDFELQRRSVSLEEDYQNRLEPIDFEDVNDVNGKKNCYLCTAAAMKDLAVTELMKKFDIDPSHHHHHHHHHHHRP